MRRRSTAFCSTKNGESARLGASSRVRTHLDGINLALELASLGGGDRGGNDGPRDTASTAEGGLGGDEDVGDVLVLAEEGEVEQDLNGLGVWWRRWVSHLGGAEDVERDEPAVMMMISEIPRLRVCSAPRTVNED
jgi:hypothetical protein